MFKFSSEFQKVDNRLMIFKVHVCILGELGDSYCPSTNMPLTSLLLSRPSEEAIKPITKRRPDKRHPCQTP